MLTPAIGAEMFGVDLGLRPAVRDHGDFRRVMARVLIASDDLPHRVRA